MSVGLFLQQGRYRIKGELGKGEFGIANLVEDYDQRRTVVIKSALYHSERSTRWELLASLRTEWELLKSLYITEELQHPVLPEVYDLFYEKKTLHLVMEYIPGQSLEERLKDRDQGPLTSLEVARYMIRLCEVLDYLHCSPEAPVFRDLHLANIICSPDGARLIDLGAAWWERYEREARAKVSDEIKGALGEETRGAYRFSDFFKKARYAAPEVIRCAVSGVFAVLTPAADVCSVGLVALRSLLVAEEFTLDQLEKLERDQLVQLARVREIPSALVSLLETMTQQEPAERPAMWEVKDKLYLIQRSLQNRLIIA